ncbi:hypothetical_protein [Leishmania braziliensis MHOM/BR/75/M2904]|uniref:Hypothetical_protein n=1 Tax=Leishmania braziliensis MHOM/BR/75/M2904 TaxID=420245 RepID=A0A3P3ZBS3_LEIBR|nr:hypothetical_protein [Leishmania braziliensis MHOM/BR/75/M2904]
MWVGVEELSSCGWCWILLLVRMGACVGVCGCVSALQFLRFSFSLPPSYFLLQLALSFHKVSQQRVELNPGVQHYSLLIYAQRSRGEGGVSGRGERVSHRTSTRSPPFPPHVSLVYLFNDAVLARLASSITAPFPFFPLPRHFTLCSCSTLCGTLCSDVHIPPLSSPEGVCLWKKSWRARLQTSELKTTNQKAEQESTTQPLMKVAVSPSSSLLANTPTTAVSALAKSLLSTPRPSCSLSSSLLRFASIAEVYSTAPTGVTCCRHVHIGHSTDVHRWRNPEKAEVQRQYRGGVKLGSHTVKVREQAAKEKELIDQDKFTDWRQVYSYALSTALLLIGLNVILAVVEPNPSPAYVPYTESVVSAPSVSDTTTDSS